MTNLYLIVDTSTRYGSIGLWSEGSLFRTHMWSSMHNHTTELMPAIATILSASRLSVDHLSGAVVAQGPGGFSALRVGLSVVKGLAFAKGLPVVGVSTIEGSAYPYRGLGMPVCALISAGRGLVAWARFRATNPTDQPDWVRRSPDRVTTLETMLMNRGRHMLFCGEGVAEHASAIRHALGSKAHTILDSGPGRRLEGIAELGASRLLDNRGQPVSTLKPTYLRSPSITQPKLPNRIRF